MTLEAYLADERTRYAVMRAYEIMGEAVGHLPQELKTANPDIPWATMAAVRNRITHAFWDRRHNFVRHHKRRIDRAPAAATCRMRSSSCDRLARLCVRHLLCWPAFPLVPTLRSTRSAAFGSPATRAARGCSALFAGFPATM